LRDHTTNDVWFTLLNGQMWRTTGHQTQYCFGEQILFEQSPFQVQEVTETSVNFCWRDGDRGMPTHTQGCKGCDCARILLNLTDPDTLAFTFWMSPPVIHADFVFTRSGPAPPFWAAIESTMMLPYQQCQIRDHYGPNIPFEPNLHHRRRVGGGCGGGASRIVETMMKDDDMSFPNATEETMGQCHQLNGDNLAIDKLSQWTDKAMNVSDVRIQFEPPRGLCEPCDVSYSVSAVLAEDEYIGIGFKGQSWEGRDPYPPEISRPCYFGMCVDSYDNFTSDRLAIGYTANGGCVREMTSDKIIGTPSDVDYKILKKTSIQRSNGRAILRFTVSQHWPKWTSFDGPFRVMWAIGKVSGGNGCTSDIGYHFNKRGVAPVKWLGVLGSTRCRYNPDEMGKESTPLIV